MFFDAYVPLQQRYIDIGLGSPDQFTFNARTNVSWLTLTPTSGVVSPQTPEQRVEITVDWSQVEGTQYAAINFNATSAGAVEESSPVYFMASHTVAPSGFKGG